MKWLLKYDKLLVVLILVIGIIGATWAVWYYSTYMRANLTDIDAVYEDDYCWWYLKVK